MENVVILNNGDGGSTGNIAKNLQRSLKEQGYRCVFCYGRGENGNDPDTYRIDSDVELKYHALMTRLTGLQGFYSKSATARLLSRFDSWNVDTIYVVCIHGYYINERMLYRYATERHVRLIHLMIDEYAFTGKCPYHDDCEQYMTGCGHCPMKNVYPASYFLDGSAKVFEMKALAYKGLRNAVFVGPEFVVEQARRSPLFRNLKTEVLDEAIDMENFYPRPVENLKKTLGISENKIVLVSVVPYDGRKNDRKGGRYFIELAKRFERDDRFVFVHVGYLNKKEEALPKNFIPIGFIKDLNLLAEYFSLGDLFVFPSILDSMPNACLDALACGTPLLCFNISGMPYVATPDVGTFVDPGNVEALSEVVKEVRKKDLITINKCRVYALSRYDSKVYNDKLIKIANNISNMAKMIPFNKPYCSGREQRYINEVCHSTTMSGNGDFTKKCHQFFEEKYGFKKCLLATSGTDALEMCAMLCELQPGDEVIIPSYTFVSTALAFLREGAKVVFSDSSKENPNCEASDIEPLITPKTKVIAVVHYAGVACDMDAIMALANKHGLIVVEDAAHSIDSYYKGRPLGSIGHLGAFSFHETKNISSGEGGMLVVNDERFIRRSEIIWEKGTNRAEFYRGMVNKYGWCDMGSSFLPSEFNAAYLWAQLEQLDDIQNKRKHIWQMYDEGLRGKIDPAIKLVDIPEYATNNAHMYYMVCPSLDYRTKLMNYLKENGVQTTFHYLPLHSSEYYKNKHDGRLLENCDRYGDCLVRLPLFYELTDAEVTHIINKIQEFCAQYKSAALSPVGG